MEIDKILTLIQSVSDSALTGFSLEEGNIKLVLEKNPGNSMIGKIQESAEEKQLVEVITRTPVVSEEAHDVAKENKSKNMYQGVAVKSPLVGTFYNAPSPDDEPFVKVGDAVKKGQVIGIIEAMKLMNEIEAESDGVIEAVLVKNEQMVEYGQDLFMIK